MTTILLIFLVSLVLSLALTPLAGKLGVRLGALDVPTERKVHSHSIPRCGGLAIFAAFFVALALSTLFMTKVSNLLIMDREITSFLFGMLVVFGVGLFDDFHRLGHRVKFLFQIIGASVAFWGGLRIGKVAFFGMSFEFGWMSYFVTVFWFLLFINAINLIDGLDGLAAGICFFVAIVMILIALYADDFYTPLFFAALAGALLGFLRFNFSPASIFMGDGGSYFLGYALAGLALIGSYKTQMSATIMIPLVALGVPIFDVILSPVRRFMRGRSLFSPDRSHIHHRLIAMGLTTQRAVIVFYGITCALCVFAIVLANFHNEFGGFLLIILGAGAFIFIRLLGYTDYFTSRNLINWLKDIYYTVGLQKQRRSLIDHQIKTERSRNDSDLWTQVASFLEEIDFDHAAYYGSNHPFNGEKSPGVHDSSVKDHTFRIRELPIAEATVLSQKKPPLWTWDNPLRAAEGNRFSHSLLRLEIPLVNDEHKHFGTILLVKDMKRGVLELHSLRQIDVMRVSVVKAMERIHKDTTEE